MWERRVVLVGAGLFRMPSKLGAPTDDGITHCELEHTRVEGFPRLTGLSEDLKDARCMSRKTLFSLWSAEQVLITAILTGLQQH